MRNSDKEKKVNIKSLFLLHIMLIMYSAGGIFSKLASKEEFLSLKFILFYGILLLDLAVYALLWQQILKQIPLTAAYANKAVTVIWVTLWGVLFFNETISVQNVIGAVIVLAGILCMVTGEDKKNE